MMVTSFVSLVESSGAFISVARCSSATPIPPSILSRGVSWQGVGILISGIFGTGNGSSVLVENVGLLALTRVGSRRVVQASAAFMIFFSMLGSPGLGFLQFCNLNSFRTKFIVGFSIFMGLSVPHYFREYLTLHGYRPIHSGARWFDDAMNVGFSSGPFVAGVVGVVLDTTLQRKYGSTEKDRGMPWWNRFMSFKTDTRSEEFYSLPFNLHKFFPSV